MRYGCLKDLMHFWSWFGHKTNILRNFKLEILFDGTYRINQVSLKNIDTWPSYGPKWPSKYKLFHIWAYAF